MALKWLRDNLRHLKFILWGVVLVFVLLVFVDWGAGRAGRGGGGDAAVRVGNRSFSETEFLDEMRRLDQRFSQIYGEQWNELRGQVDLARQTANMFIDRELQLTEARRVGLTVTPEELQEVILQDPSFRNENGDFVGTETYTRIIRAAFRTTPEMFEQRLTEDLLIGKLNSLAERNVWISDDEVDLEFRRQRELSDFDVIQLRYEPFLSEVEISEEDARTAFEATAEEYHRDEERTIRYLLVETTRLRRTLPVDEVDLRAYYDQHVDEFLEGEQARARHILFRLAPDATEIDRGEAELRANGVATIARSGADFAVLASEHSEDPGSKDLGGDLGWFGRGQMVPEFENVVFSAKPGDIVGPVKSQFGYHVIKVEGFRPEHQQPFEEVQEQIRFRVLEDRAVGEAEARAGVLARRLKSEAPDSEEQWQAIADEDEAVVLNQSPPFSAGEAIAGASDGPELADTAFAASVGDITGPVAVPRGWIVWQLAEVRPEGVPPFEDVRTEVEQKLRRERAVGLASDQGQQLAVRWRGGEDGSKLAAEYGSNVTEARQHRRGQVVGALGVLPGLDSAVFAASEGEVLGPIKAGLAGGVVVAKVSALDLVDPVELEGSRDDLRARLTAERGAQLMRSILNERRRDTVVTVDEELLQRFAPSRS
ncbi:MAG: peptidyl-prolyl cis-trans isomerase [Thermoanaerobaculales bacterium]|nr:peptidyl-prolyl cis-trans isomerase [Thermoanaerobaculales bacterium]